MCGIVGYIGQKKASPILINGLLKLEYRGYDSAGLSTLEDNTISIIKNKGRVNSLNDIPELSSLEGTIGIAHTRWATHGKPSTVNSHPHMDNSKTFSVVHNGIIENYNDLRIFLTNNGYNFLSQTDTEVIPNLIHYYFSKDTENDDKKFLRAVKSACNDFKGSYAIEVISSLYPDRIIVTRKDILENNDLTESDLYFGMPDNIPYTYGAAFIKDSEQQHLHATTSKWSHNGSLHGHRS